MPRRAQQPLRGAEARPSGRSRTTGRHSRAGTLGRIDEAVTAPAREEEPRARVSDFAPTSGSGRVPSGRLLLPPFEPPPRRGFIQAYRWGEAPALLEVLADIEKNVGQRIPHLARLARDPQVVASVEHGDGGGFSAPSNGRRGTPPARRSSAGSVAAGRGSGGSAATGTPGAGAGSRGRGSAPRARGGGAADRAGSDPACDLHPHGGHPSAGSDGGRRQVAESFSAWDA